MPSFFLPTITPGIAPPVPASVPAGASSTVYTLTTQVTSVAVCASGRANSTARQRMAVLQQQFDSQVAQLVCAAFAGGAAMGPAPAQVILSDTLQVNQNELVFGIYQVWGVRKIQVDTLCP